MTEYKLNQPVYIEHDNESYILGYFAGYGSMVGNVVSNDSETVYPIAIVRIDSDSCGWVHREGKPSSFISHQVVDLTNLKPASYYVNVYERDRCYGGAEEGGWYYNTYEIVHTSKFDTERDAEQYAKDITDDYPTTGNYTSVVYSGGDYVICIENTPGESTPLETPHYE
jgi:hypothetical protein